MIEKIVFFLLLVDSIGANLVAWIGEEWYTKHFRWLSRYFPPAEGWALYYLILVLWIGTLVFRVN